MADVIVAAADGSSLSNPGPSGWAWYVDEDHWAAGGWKRGTNNMGELMAVLDLLKQTAQADDLHVLCDSQYVINSLTRWMPGRGNGRAGRRPTASRCSTSSCCSSSTVSWPGAPSPSSGSRATHDHPQ